MSQTREAGYTANFKQVGSDPILTGASDIGTQTAVATTAKEQGQQPLRDGPTGFDASRG